MSNSTPRHADFGSYFTIHFYSMSCLAMLSLCFITLYYTFITTANWMRTGLSESLFTPLMWLNFLPLVIFMLHHDIQYLCPGRTQWLQITLWAFVILTPHIVCHGTSWYILSLKHQTNYLGKLSLPFLVWFLLNLKLILDRNPSRNEMQQLRLSLLK